MKNSIKMLIVLFVMCFIALSASSCGSDDKDDNGGSTDSAETSTEEVITGVALRESDADYVDSALNSQYETVTFSSGRSQSIDVDTQTFVLTIDGTIVDLDDPANWTPNAALSVVEKGMNDTVAMSMNNAYWGPFFFTAAAYIQDGKYHAAKSVTSATESVVITDEGMTGGVIDTDANYIGGVFVYGDNGEKYSIDDVTFNCAGLGGNDFGKNGAWGAAISVAGNAQVEATGLVVNTKGPLHDGVWAGGSSVVNVKDSVVWAVEGGKDYNFVPYNYDRYIITKAPLTSGEIASYGISGEHFEEPYEDRSGSGTNYYYENANYTSNFSAPMLQCVPVALGLYGSMRATCCYGKATLSFYGSLVVSDVWAVLSTDSGSGTLNATDTIGAVGVETDAAGAELTAEVNGKEYYIDLYDTTEGSGYVTYCDGFDDNFYGCRFYAPDYLAIISGGTFDFTSSDTGRGYGRSDRIGFLSHGRGYTTIISHSDFDIADGLFSVMSTGAVDITLDDVTVNWTSDNAWKGVLFQFMDTDDTGTNANDLEMDIIDLTYAEYVANTAAEEGTVKTVTIKNSTLAGDIYNSTGSSNNATTLSAYDGSTNYLSSWRTSTVNVNLDASTLDGVISTSYAQHCNKDGNAIVGQFFFNKTGEPMDGTADNTYTYLAGRRVINTVAYNGVGMINVTLTNDAVWNVTDTCILNSLKVEDGCTVNGTVIDNANGTITVMPL